MSELLKELVDFHENAEMGVCDKASLYLSGISALALETMERTNATEFKISATLNPKGTNKEYEYVYTLKEKTDE